MNIVCPSCSAVYRFDVSRIPASGKKVQCSQCNFVFVVRPPDEPGSDGVSSAEPLSAAPGESSLTGAEVMMDSLDVDREQVISRRLILRQDGTRYSVKDMMTLQRWIVERRITREAELSEDGDNWEKIGERADLTNFFEMVERSRTSGPLTSQVGTTSTRVGGRVEGVRVVTTLRPRPAGAAELGDEDEFDEWDDDDDDEYDDDYDDEDYDDDDDDDEVDDLVSLDDDVEEIVVPNAGVATPVFTKSQVLGTEDVPSEDDEQVFAVATSKSAASEAAQTQQVEQRVDEEEPSSKAGLWLVAAMILLAIGGGWYLTRPDGTTVTVASKGPVVNNSGGPTGPMGPPLGPNGRPIVEKTPQPTKAPTPQPTMAPTQPPTPEPTAVPVKATPKPRRISKVTKPPKKQPPRTPRPAPVSPREAADKAYEKGKALQKAGDLSGAIASFQRANQMLPTPLYYEELGFAYLAMHDASRKPTYLQDAEASFRNAVARDGSRASSYLGLGWVYRRQNRLDDAMRAVNACLARSPDADTRLEAEGLKKSLEERKAMGG